MRKISIVVILLSFYFAVNACTSFLIKGASEEGANMISYNADSHVMYGELYHWAAAKYPEGAYVKRV
ncbi:MAG: hypothetical protein R2771_01790 [Saprospiraceae bacterium]